MQYQSSFFHVPIEKITLDLFFSCPEQLNRWPCHSLTHSVTNFYFCHTKSNPRDLLPLRHLIRVMRRHDLSEKDLPNSEILKDSQKIWKFRERISTWSEKKAGWTGSLVSIGLSMLKVKVKVFRLCQWQESFLAKIPWCSENESFQFNW